MKMFKKIMCIVLVVVMCLTTVPFNGFVGLGSWLGNVASATNDLSATGQCGDNVYWNFNNVTGELIISGSGEMYDYAVDTSPFYQKSTILKVTIEEGITTVGACSFSKCDKLTNIVLPQTLKAINKNAFMYCTSLSNIDIPEGVTVIQENTFVYCSSLECIVIPEGVTSIKDQAFMYCSNLSSLILPNTLTDIGGGAFYDCSKLSDIVIPYNATNWGSAIFAQSAITDIYIPNGVEIIGDYMFSGCEKLEKVTIPITVTTINYAAFGSCTKLTDIYYEGTQEDWEKINIAGNNDSLDTVTVHYNSEMIRTETLYSYRTKIHMTSSNPEEEGYIYEGSGWSEDPIKTQIVKYAKTWPSGSSTTKGFKTDSTIYKQYDKPSVSETDTTKTVLGDESKAKTVGYLYWHWCYSHTDTDDGPINCVIKDNKAGKVAKYNANGQATGTYYTTSNFHAFDTTSSLAFNSSAHAYKKSYTDECKYTYWWSGLNFGKSGNIEIISNTLSTYEKEYYHYKWSEWSDWSKIPVEETSDIEVKTMVVEKPLKGGKCGEDVYYVLNKNGTLTISGTGPMYDFSWDDDEATGMPSYMTWEYEEIDGEMWIVGDKTIKKVVIEPGVTTIGDYAFNACTALKSVEIADTVTSIGAVAFDYCIGLKHIDIPGSVKVIKEEAFSESGLETIEIENGLEQIDQIAFLFCQSLKEVALPESVTTIGDFAFIMCDKLETLVIDNKDCEIGLEILMTGKLDEYGNPVEDENGNPIPTECPTLLKGYSGSTAEEYAKMWTEAGYPIKFEAIDHVYTEIKTVSATCTERGYTLSECTKCGLKKEINIIAPLGHNYTEKIMDAAHLVSTATYEKGSVYKFDCSRCESVGEETFECDDKLVAVTGVTLNKTSITLKKGDSQTLTATVKPDNATDKIVKWSSSNTSVATVDSGGKVKAVGKGTATITAKNERSSKLATCNVTVTVPVTGVSLNKTSVSVAKGQTYQLKATIKPGDANNKNVNWSSSNTNVATVNSSGKVTAKAVGTATITVKTKDGGKTATCKVTVVNNTVKVTGVKLNFSTMDVALGTCTTIKATVSPSNATNKAVTWTSSNNKIVSVTSKGELVAHNTGTATITVKTKDGGKTATCKVGVYNQDVYSSKLDFVDGIMYLNFKDSYFEGNSTNYNHNLAKLCSQLCVIGYGVKKGNTKDATYLKKGLALLSFDEIEYELRASRNNVNYFIANRDIIRNGTTYKVVAMGFCGSNENQWYSNFDPGTEGDVHQGFLSAKNYISKILETYIKGYDKNKTILLITGHSRGAAVANLLAAELIDSEKYAISNNIYTYTFATPNCTADPGRFTYNSEGQISGEVERYKRIFNIVNPEDLVTKLLPNTWVVYKDLYNTVPYGRYGTTLTLPSSTNETPKSYKVYLDGMQKQFSKLTCGGTYDPFKNGEEPVYSLMKTIREHIKSREDFYKEMKYNRPRWFKIAYKSPYVYFRDYLCPIVATLDDVEKALNAIYFLISESTTGLYEPFESIKSFFVNYGMTNFSDSHLIETYCAYMQFMDYDQAYTWAKGNYRKPYKNTVNCPVDIEVYDKDTDELVGRIVDNVVDEEVTSIVMYVEGDSKSFWLPSNGNYDVKLIGNDSGEMDYTVSTIDSDLGEVERINFLDVPVEEGFEYVGEFAQEDFSIDEYTLTTELGDTVEKTEKLTEEEFNTLDISVNVEGLGYVKGEGVYTSGDYIVLEAVTDENNEFIGWYEEDELISKEATLAFVVQENKTLKAKFTDVYVEATGLSLSESEITLDDSDENSYVVLEATLTPANATNTGFEWSSSDDTVATVSEFGFVRAIGCGTATITVSFADGKLTETCMVTVECKNHSISDETIESYASCTQDGYGYNTCKLCGYIENFKIGKYDHIYESKTVAATCTSNGYVVNECVSCDYSYKSDTILMLSHNFGEWYEITTAFCETPGLEQRDCIGCSHHEVNEIPAKGHSFDGDICTECGESRAADCSCNCHKSGIVRLFFKIILFFQRIFKSNKECKCGIYHY